jgi:FlaA1/EpsC-like NDP-sugar epimerase
MSNFLVKNYSFVSDFLREMLIKSSPRWLVLLIDIFLVVNSLLITYLVRFNFGFSFKEQHLLTLIPLLIFLSFISFLATGSYKGIVRHTGFKDAMSVVQSAVYITVALFIIVFLVRQFDVLKMLNMPLSVIGINFFVMVFLLVVSRVIYKGFYYYLKDHLKQPQKILIHGANTGQAVYNALQTDDNNKYEVLGFVDERAQYKNKLIDRIRIYHPKKITDSFITDKQIDAIIISKPEATPIELLDIANKYLDLGVKVKTVPHINQWIDNKISVSQIKELNIEELLNRASINIDNPEIKNEIQNSVVLVTGAAGSIGSEIALQVIGLQPKKLILLDQAESALYDLQQDFIRKGFDTDIFTAIVGDVRDVNRMNAYFNKFKPEIVFHAAAYKHVPLMEENPYEAVKVNVLGSKTVMDLAVKYETKRFVMISTDKAVNPTNVMGATKRAAEMYATCAQKNTDKTKFIITRFGNVLGSNGSVIQLFKKQIKQGGPLTVTHRDIVRFFMTIPEACQLVLEAGIMGKGGEIFVFDMGEPVKIYDLAKKMIQLSGLRFPEDIDIKITGLRPGEKLYEETLGQNEGDLPTHHDRVMIAQINEIPKDVILNSIDELKKYQELTDLQIVQILKTMIPEYISNNSIFEKLDN